MSERVVITGLGVVSPLGNTREAFWQAVVAGQSAAAPITLFNAEKLNNKIACEVKGFDPAAHFDARQISMLDRFAQFAVAAGVEAANDSGLNFKSDLGLETACIKGTGVGGQNTIEEQYRKLLLETPEGQQPRVHPFTVPRLMANAGTSQVAMALGIKGPAFTAVSACASSTHAIGIAYQMVRAGMVKAAITGGSEAVITYGTLKGWEALRVMSPDVCRPFSLSRKGMVLGEGASMMVIESLTHAKARGAKIYAEIIGFGMSSDAKDITTPDIDGMRRALVAALNDARIAPDAVEYINAHGTGTAANDASESKAIHAAFGAHAGKLMVSSSKSMFGHALGAAGALEAAVTTLAIRDGIVPATINFEAPDPECALDVVPNVARQKKIRVALSNSFAFGGLNAVLAFREFS